MKTYIEMADEVFRKGDEQINTANIKKKKTVITLSLVCVTLVAVGVWLNTDHKITAVKPSGNETSVEVAAENSTGESVESNETTLTEERSQETEQEEKITTTTPENNSYTSADSEETKDGASYGGNSWFCIPCFPRSNKIDYVGEKLTDAEAKAYFSEEKSSIASALSSSGVPADKIEIKEKGYSHISYTGKENENLTLTQNFRDYLVYNGNELVAIITLVKENGKIYNTPSFGATWFSDYNNFLNAHKGEKLVYVYVNQVELIVTPDGTAYNTFGVDMSQYFDGVDNAYNRLYCAEDVYIP